MKSTFSTTLRTNKQNVRVLLTEYQQQMYPTSVQMLASVFEQQQQRSTQNAVLQFIYPVYVCKATDQKLAFIMIY